MTHLDDANAPRGRWDVGGRVDAWFFSPGSAFNLGVCRAMFFAIAVLVFFDAQQQLFGQMPASYWQPIWLFRKLELPLLSTEVMTVMQWCWKAGLVFACVGLGTRWLLWPLAILQLYMVGVQYNFGKVGHGETVLVLGTFFLAASRCADAFSIDALLRRRRDPPGSAVPSGEYTWPVRIFWIQMSLVFFCAGLMKMHRSGLDWALSDNFRNTLLAQHYYGDQGPMLSWGLTIAEYPLLCKTMAMGALVMELVFPLVLISRWARWIIVPLGLLMQLGIGLLMGVWFTKYLAGYLFFVPWDRVIVRRFEP